MDTPEKKESAQPKAAPKKAAKLPSKSISFSGQATKKNGAKGGKAQINSQKKGGVNLMKKLSGM
jgi:hypothetical protein